MASAIGLNPVRLSDTQFIAKHVPPVVMAHLIAALGEQMSDWQIHNPNSQGLYDENWTGVRIVRHPEKVEVVVGKYFMGKFNLSWGDKVDSFSYVDRKAQDHYCPFSSAPFAATISSVHAPTAQKFLETVDPLITAYYNQSSATCLKHSLQKMKDLRAFSETQEKEPTEDLETLGAQLSPIVNYPLWNERMTAELKRHFQELSDRMLQESTLASIEALTLQA